MPQRWREVVCCDFKSNPSSSYRVQFYSYNLLKPILSRSRFFDRCMCFRNKFSCVVRANFYIHSCLFLLVKRISTYVEVRDVKIFHTRGSKISLMEKFSCEIKFYVRAQYLVRLWIESPKKSFKKKFSIYREAFIYFWWKISPSKI